MTTDVEIAKLKERVKSLEKRCKNMVSLERFKPIENLGYGLTGTILIALVGAVVALVLKQ